MIESSSRCPSIPVTLGWFATVAAVGLGEIAGTGDAVGAVELMGAGVGEAVCAVSGRTTPNAIQRSVARKIRLAGVFICADQNPAKVLRSSSVPLNRSRSTLFLPETPLMVPISLNCQIA